MSKKDQPRPVGRGQLIMMDSKGRLIQDLTREDSVAEDEGTMDWISADTRPTHDRRYWLKEIDKNYRYATSENQAFDQHMRELKEKNRKLREVHEAKKRKEAGTGEEAAKKIARTAAVGSDSLYAMHQPNVTEAHDERESSGARPTSDFTNPTAAAFDLYDQKGGLSSSSHDVKNVQLKRTFDVASLIRDRAKQKEAAPMPEKAEASLEDRARKEQQLRKLTTCQAKVERSREADIATSLAAISADPLYERVLNLNLKKVVGMALKGADEVGSYIDSSSKLEAVPNRFRDHRHYREIFEPLLLEEVTASLGQHIAGGLSGGKKGGRVQGTTEVVVVRGAPREKAKREKGEVVMVELEVTLPKDSEGREIGRALHKEDLVVLLHKAPPSPLSLAKFSQLLKEGYCLAVVATAAQRTKGSRDARESTHRSGLDALPRYSQKLLLPAKMLGLNTEGKIKIPKAGLRYQALPITSLTTFCREHAAIQSIHIPQLMPLASYILKASPVVSCSTMIGAKDELARRIKSLELLLLALSSRDTADNKLRVAKAFATVSDQLAHIASLPVDGSVMSQSGMGRYLKNGICKNRNLIEALPELKIQTEALMNRWTAQIKRDHNAATLKGLKGGNVVTIPQKVKEEAATQYLQSPAPSPDKVVSQSDSAALDQFLESPKGCPPALWSELRRKFNVSQLFSIKHVGDKLDGGGARPGLDTRIALLQGPPGTGKTSTILGMVSLFLSRDEPGPTTSVHATSGAVKRPKKSRILLCTPSNAAVDEILLRIIREKVLDQNGQPRDVNVVRLGESDDPHVAALTLDAQVETRLQTHAAMKRHLRTKKRVSSLQSRLSKLAPHSSKTVNVDAWKANTGINGGLVGEETFLSVEEQITHIKTEISRLNRTGRDEERELEAAKAYLREEIMRSSDIVAGTCSGAGKAGFVDLLLKGELSFEVCIVDEASQCSEPSTLVPLRYGCANLVLVGDPRQLPATVISPAAQEAGLGASLFDRLERCGHDVVMLSIQYRMHPDIRLFPSQAFYQGQLEDSVFIQREMASLSGGAIGDTEIGEESEEASQSRNDTVSSQVCLFGSPGKTFVEDATYLTRPLEVGPLNFYNLRSSREESCGSSFVNTNEARFSVFLVQRLMFMFGGARSVAVITPYKAQRALVHKMMPAELQEKVEVNTVDGFQGREKDCVVFCCVRDGRSKGIGFLADRRRMNVAITRARSVLCIVGCSPGVAACNSTWRALVDSVAERKMLINVETREV